jgi:hypothetical protein
MSSSRAKGLMKIHPLGAKLFYADWQAMGRNANRRFLHKFCETLDKLPLQ